MKQKYWRAGILLVLLALTAGLLLYAFLPGKQTLPDPPTSTSTTAVTNSTPAYYLKAYGNKIAAFEAGNGQPLEVLDVYVEDLPEGDQAQLRSSGIPAADKDALRRLVEDYGG